jgi:2-polyprenyl-6-methoxyphenol hydroxylase-like FAD-dependent oxidoreductase
VTRNAPVLVVGAGPTGLVLALGLARRGIPVRIVDLEDGPGRQSRAMAVHARTLEFYRQFGFADRIVAAGIPARAAHFRERNVDGTSREVAIFSFEDFGAGLSPYPFVLAYPQDDHERFLVDRLAELGVNVEWRVRLRDFAENRDGDRVPSPEDVGRDFSRGSRHAVTATLEHADGRLEKIETPSVCGCDGAHSRVREILDIGFPGGTYDQLFYVADVRIDGPVNEDLVFNLGEHSLALMLPVRSTGMQRLIGLVPDALTGREDLAFEDVRSTVEPLLGVRVAEVNWFSTYRVHHRVAERFRAGRAFIAGDAAHIHSPAGGQGMNTGIGDAVNLAWKLANVLEGRADPAVLDTYEPERIAFARSLVATTDRGFTAIVAEGLTGEIVRRVIAPSFAAIFSSFALTRRTLFRAVSQLRIHYPDSALSQGKAGDVRGGDRLPWLAQPDNFGPLASLEWQAHVYGEPEPGLQSICRDLSLPLHEFAWSEAAEGAGFARGAAYLVRPDGYVAVAADGQPAARLRAFVERFRLVFTQRPSDR